MSATMKPGLTRRFVKRASGRGGWRFSEEHYEILADGEPTGITLRLRTDGRPHYRITARELRHGEDVLDLMERDGPAPTEWIYARLAAPDPSPED